MRISTYFCACCFGLALLTASSQRAGANDSSSSGIGGRWRMLKSEHKQVQMVSEVVHIVQQPRGDFQTTADFVFRNHGPATTVTMGFPEAQGGDAANGSPSLFHFATWVDGHRVLARRRKLSGSEEDFTALWVKQVRFGRGATRHVRVRYLSFSGGGESSGYSWVSYNFTGGNWQGKVRQSILDVRFLPGWYRFDVLKDGLKDNPAVTRQGARFRFRWTNWQAQTDFQLGYITIFPNELATEHEQENGGGGAASFLAIEPGGVPLYQGIPLVRDCGNSILLQGHIWVRAQQFASCQWSEKRRGMILRFGKRACFVSARGAVRNSGKWPLDPKRPFWVISMGNQGFFVPARLILQKFGGKFETHDGQVLYRNGKFQKLL